MSKELENLTYCNEALKLENQLRKGFLALAGVLHNIREKRLYEPQWASFEEYLMEFKDISSSTASKLIKIHEKFVEEYHFPQGKLEKVGWTGLYTIANVSDTKENAEYWIQIATEQTQNDLKKTVREELTGESMMNCKHKETFTIKVCKDCGQKERIYE